MWPVTPDACGPCGAFQRKRSVVSVRSRACARVIHPRSTPTGYAARPKPIAATLENDGRRCAVGDEAVLRVGELPEEAERARLDGVEERVVA